MSSLPFDAKTDAEPWPVPHGLLQRADAKAQPRRFAATPAAPSAFGDLPVQHEAEVEPELSPEVAKALSLLRGMKMQARHADLTALISRVEVMLGEAADAMPGFGYDDVQDLLTDAFSAMDNVAAPSAEERAEWAHDDREDKACDARRERGE